MAYVSCYVFVFKNHRPDVRQYFDQFRFGLKIFLVLTWPIVANSFVLIDACIGTTSYFQGQDLPSHQVFELAVGATVVVNLTITNYFILKVLGIAAIQKCTSREKEQQMMLRLKQA